MEFETTPIEIKGVKIILLNLDVATSGPESIYGIKKLKIKRPG